MGQQEYASLIFAILGPIFAILGPIFAILGLIFAILGPIFAIVEAATRPGGPHRSSQAAAASKTSTSSAPHYLSFFLSFFLY